MYLLLSNLTNSCCGFLLYLEYLGRFFALFSKFFFALSFTYANTLSLLQEIF